MTIRSLWPALFLLAPCAAVASPPRALTFEDAVQQSDRIVVGTVRGAGIDSVKLPGGGELALGIRDPSTGLVFTPYRIRVVMCLLDTDASCRPGDAEVLIPGGTIYETVNGGLRLRTWEIAGAAGVPLPSAGDDVLLFLRKRGDRYFPLNAAGARVRVDRSSGTDSVVLRFASPRFLSAEGRRAAQARAAQANPEMTAPVFIESVPLDRLKEMTTLARTVPKPTSGTRHAIPDRADAHASLTVLERGRRLCAGDDAHRGETSLGLRDHLGSTHRADDDRRECGP
jgi:hypothetical protein